ncbi:MAG: DUF2330 domain-containing protein [Candidatus Eisenbacteria bacterium]
MLPLSFRSTRSRAAHAAHAAFARVRRAGMGFAAALGLAAALALIGGGLAPAPARAFCGFYIASGDAKLFNRASEVVLVRDGDRTVLTMANDFRGEPREFAMVVPVPTVLKRGQIQVGDRAVLDHLDAYSAPRLVEYFDENPCAPRLAMERSAMAPMAAGMARDEMRQNGAKRGVTIEARYTVGEYDILILSAKESDGLETWLRERGYRLPVGASRALSIYLKQGMKFFVARVNLTEQKRLGFANLRPLQMAYESPKFMLPIRLGMVNADGVQELIVYSLTRNGRIETTNYRNVKLPTDLELPLYVEKEFAKFYKAMFGWQTRKESMGVVFTEYAWDMSWCDPCASQPLSNEELKKLGVFWLDDATNGAPPVFLTRLHARYDRASFPEDLVFQQSGDKGNFQGRYILRRPWTGDMSCKGATAYKRELNERRGREATNLAMLTGWKLETIRARMAETGEGPISMVEPAWWEKLGWGSPAASK